MTSFEVSGVPDDVVSTFARVGEFRRGGSDVGYLLRVHGFRSEFVVDPPRFGHYVTESRCMDIDQIRDEAVYFQGIAAQAFADTDATQYREWRYRVARWWAAAFRAALTMTDTRPEDVIR